MFVGVRLLFAFPRRRFVCVDLLAVGVFVCRVVCVVSTVPFCWRRFVRVAGVVCGCRFVGGARRFVRVALLLRRTNSVTFETGVALGIGSW